MTSAIVVGSGPNGLAAALTLASEGIEVTVLEAADTLGGGTRTSELTLPGLLHDECSAAHPLAVDTPFTRRFDLAAHGLTWRWPEVQYAHPLDGGAGAAAYRSVEETADGLGRDGRRVAIGVRPARRALRRHHRRLPAPDAARARAPAQADPVRPVLGAAGGGARSPLVDRGGAGAVRRRCRPRLPAVRLADVLGDRRGPRHGGAPLRLAGRRRRLGLDQPRDDRAARGCRRAVRDRRPGAVARRARLAGHRHARRRAGRRGADRRRSDAAPDRAGADALPPRPRDLQGRLRRRGRGPVGLRARAAGGHRARRAAASRRSPPARSCSTPGGCPTRRSCSSASSTWPTRRARTATCTPCTPTPTSPPATPATPPRRSRRRSSGSRPGSATGSSPVTCDRSRRRRRTTPTTSAATSSPAATTRCSSCSARASRSTRTRTGIPGRVHLLGGHAPRRRRPRHVRLQRRAVGAAADRPRPFHAGSSCRKPPSGRPGGDDSGHPIAHDVAGRFGGRRGVAAK